MARKIGIITYHRAINYGSVLQAYALNKYLRKCGHEVETIDYYSYKQENLYYIFQPYNTARNLVRNLHSLLYKKKLNIKKKKFDTFIIDNIPLSKNKYRQIHELSNHSFDYDIYFVGSDQVWNPLCIDFDEVYLLSFVKDKKKCNSYAPSIAIQDISLYKDLFYRYLKDFRFLSVRESLGVKLIENIVHRKVEEVVDPVLLLKKEEWSEIGNENPINEPYILCYFIGNIPNMRKFAIKMSKHLKLTLIVIIKDLRELFYQNKKFYDAGPCDFISLIKNASYVCTNSYHAVLFSLIYKINFWVFVNEEATSSSNSRIYNIGLKLGFTDRILNSNCDKIEFDKDINFEGIDKLMQHEIERSKEYLDSVLGAYEV